MDATRNLNRVDWKVFRDLTKIVEKMDSSSIESIDDRVDCLMKTVMSALDSVCPARPPRKARPVPWVNQSILAKRKEVNKLYRRRDLHFVCMEKYKHARAEYRRIVRKSKIESWRSFASSLESSKDIARMVRQLRSEVQENIGLIRKQDNTFAKTPSEAISVLLQAHFPESSKCKPNIDFGHEWIDSEMVLNRSVTRKALASFGKKKAAGPDGLRPIILQNLHDSAIDLVTDIYRLSIARGYIPKLWRTMNVVFIPKMGKDDYGQAKSFRPITLSNFLLKGLERIVQWQVQHSVLKHSPLFNQHAYTANYSTETALTEAIDFIEKGIYQDQSVLVVSLDCTGAFDYISFVSAKESMEKLGISTELNRWYQHLLRDRHKSMMLATTSYLEGGPLKGEF